MFAYLMHGEHDVRNWYFTLSHCYFSNWSCFTKPENLLQPVVLIYFDSIWKEKKIKFID